MPPACPDEWLPAALGRIPEARVAVFGDRLWVGTRAGLASWKARDGAERLARASAPE